MSPFPSEGEPSTSSSVMCVALGDHLDLQGKLTQRHSFRSGQEACRELRGDVISTIIAARMSTFSRGIIQGFELSFDLVSLGSLEEIVRDLISNIQHPR